MDALPAGSVPESTAHPSALDRAVAAPAPTPPDTRTPDPQPMQDVRDGIAGGRSASVEADQFSALQRTVNQVIDQFYANPAEARERLGHLTPAERTTLAVDPSILGPLRPDVASNSSLGPGLYASTQSADLVAPNALREASQAPQISHEAASPEGTAHSAIPKTTNTTGGTPVENQIKDNLDKSLSIHSMSI